MGMASNHKLYTEFVTRLSSGLRKKSITTCARWAEQFRVLGGKDFPGPWSFKHHPWLREMHNSKARMNIGQKSSQMGYTETVLNKTFFKIDIERVDTLYVLPSNTPDASNFSAARFDPALELSPHLANMFSAVKNVGHKRAGATNLYIRGSKSRAGLKSVPVGFLVLDEVNEMMQENIPLAMERQSGQLDKECWAISTPTSEGFGINEYFQQSTQEHFFFKCPACSRLTELVYPESVILTGESLNDPLVKDSHLICKECKNLLHHQTKSDWLSTGRWVPSFTAYDDRGFYINHLYSPTVTPADFCKAFLRGQHNESDEQEFWNSKLGLPRTPDGSRITDAHIADCVGDHLNGDDKPNTVITLGVDVGKWLHYEIVSWQLPSYATNDINIESRARSIKIGKCQNFEDLDILMREYYVTYCVIDAHPERRKALEFANRNWGRVKMCFYGRGVQGKQIHIHADDEPGITVDRTSWLDLSLGRFRARTITLPRDTPDEYKMHLKALVRINVKDPDGNPVGRYEKKHNDHDHYGHARTYSELALPLAAKIVSSHNIRSPV